VIQFELSIGGQRPIDDIRRRELGAAKRSPRPSCSDRSRHQTDSFATIANPAEHRWPLADVLLGLDQTVYESMLAETTSTVQMLTAHAPRTLPDWLAQNIALFAQ
jgi:hypothetical protein